MTQTGRVWVPIENALGLRAESEDSDWPIAMLVT